MDELSKEYWQQFNKADWENPQGYPVAALVRARHEQGAGLLAEAACKASGADFNTFLRSAQIAIEKAAQDDTTRWKAPGEPVKAIKGPGLTCLGNVPPKEMTWLWEPYIPSGSMTIIQGDPGCGKTFFAVWLAAMVTNGGKTPDWKPVTKGSVIFQSIEDGVAEGLVPRLIAAGADMTKVHAFDESDDPLHVQDLDRIEAAFKMLPDLRMMVVDPIQSYLGAKTDMNRANEVRAALNGLLNLCNQYNVALVMLGHLNKGQGKNLYRLLGSIDFIGSARSVLTIGESQHSQDTKAVLHTKVSNAPKGDAFTYTIENRRVVFGEFKPNMTEYDLTSKPKEDLTRLDDAARFIYDALNDKPLTVNEMEKEGKQADITSSALRKARDKMKEDNVLSVRKIGYQGAWYWYIKGKSVVEFNDRLIYMHTLDTFEKVPEAVGFAGA